MLASHLRLASPDTATVDVDSSRSVAGLVVETLGAVVLLEQLTRARVHLQRPSKGPDGDPLPCQIERHICRRGRRRNRHARPGTVDNPRVPELADPVMAIASQSGETGGLLRIDQAIDLRIVPPPRHFAVRRQHQNRAALGDHKAAAVGFSGQPPAAFSERPAPRRREVFLRGPDERRGCYECDQHQREGRPWPCLLYSN